MTEAEEALNDFAAYKGGGTGHYRREPADPKAIAKARALLASLPEPAQRLAYAHLYDHGDISLCWASRSPGRTIPEADAEVEVYADRYAYVGGLFRHYGANSPDTMVDTSQVMMYPAGHVE